MQILFTVLFDYSFFSFFVFPSAHFHILLLYAFVFSIHVHGNRMNYARICWCLINFCVFSYHRHLPSYIHSLCAYLVFLTVVTGIAESRSRQDSTPSTLKMSDSQKFQLGTIGALSLSVVSSVSIVICNKALISTLGFTFGELLNICSL